MRRSELERMQASDVDLTHGLITIRGTKTAAARRQVPIEPSLRPLLKILVSERKSGPVLHAPRADGKGGASDLMKKDLERAKLTRPDLHRDDADYMPFTFHGLRHTAITHWVVSGKTPLWLLLNSRSPRRGDDPAIPGKGGGPPRDVRNAPPSAARLRPRGRTVPADGLRAVLPTRSDSI